MRFVFFILFLFASFFSAAQKSLLKKTYRFSATCGVGISHYINSLKIATNSADENQVAFVLKMMWEPEHRLALGLESGYYTFYTVERTSTNGAFVAKASLAVLPIMLHIRFRVYKDFYLSTGTGASILFSKVEGLGSTAESSQTSLSNFQLSALYIYPLRTNNRIRVGGELKYLSVDKTDDEILSLMALVSYRF
jgi:hypothetical protein